MLDSKIKMIYQLETIIAKSNNKMSAHNIKWSKYKVCNNVQFCTAAVRICEKNCLQCKKDDKEGYVCVVSVSECSRVVRESSVNPVKHLCEQKGIQFPGRSILPNSSVKSCTATSTHTASVMSVSDVPDTIEEENLYLKMGITKSLVYVIAWGQGQLRINFMSIFKVFTKLPELRSKEGNLENFENTSEINL